MGRNIGHHVAPTTVPNPEGLGQSWWRDLLWWWRFRQSRRIAISWFKPMAPDADRIERHPQIRRFGDITIAIAQFDGKQWIARERDWFGWPDPPRYVVFALQGETIWMARDFDRWPLSWSGPLAA
jgi:hypothetical protein